MINEMADTARLAARTLSAATGAERRAALNAIADAVLARSAEILAANEEDMVRARAAKINDSLLDRLLLTPARIEGIAKSAREVSNLPDPLGITLRHSILPNGIDVKPVYQHQNNHEVKKIVFCSRLQKRKGIDKFIKKPIQNAIAKKWVKKQQIINIELKFFDGSFSLY